MFVQINWKPDKTVAIPLYLQIKHYIQTKIEDGEWTVGTKIPSQRKLAELFDVNRSTVVLAFDELIADGLLEAKSGKGTKVKNNLWSLFSSTHPTDWNSIVRKGIYQPNLPTIQDIHKVEPLPQFIRLGTGEPSPELFPQEMMTEILHRLSSKIQSLGYEEEKGLLPLREQLSIYLKSIGIQASPSSILVVSGALQALQLISLGLLKRGSNIFLERPSYLSSLNVFQSAAIGLQSISVDSEGFDIQYIKQQKKRQDASLLYTNPTFHNPTGYVMPLESREKLLQVCEDIQLPIVEDDVYRELWLDTPPPVPIKALDKNGTVLYLGSISKSLSPGLRIGWVVGPEPVIDRLADIKMQTDYGASSLSQWAVAEFLSSGFYDLHLEQMRNSLRIRRDLTLKVLEEKFTGIAEWKKPAGGFYIWLRLPSTISIRELFDTALKEGILLNPGNLYDPNSLHHLRLSYSYASKEQLQTGLNRLAEIIRKLLNKS
ncbi:PLP-dependent aminotransferase family protein [Bacillus suaedaesalsae]|uniref:PLP-dependent aminotransferase family protein n=1 Tax=Bacillus suaedaesalsae TaxID=2810349 RepID=A0ABS2DD95_9BACI|nr:PLP-dependent aminotransferase family protein [Bacillus suaedaesalsae]MBM6616413.1 PLP-dependent aminotransferase family protein [Bacillus suaedaesalsae]